MKYSPKLQKIIDEARSSSKNIFEFAKKISEIKGHFDDDNWDHFKKIRDKFWVLLRDRRRRVITGSSLWTSPSRICRSEKILLREIKGKPLTDEEKERKYDEWWEREGKYEYELEECGEIKYFWHENIQRDYFGERRVSAREFYEI